MRGALGAKSFSLSTCHHGLKTAPDGEFSSRRKNFSIESPDIIYLTSKMNSQPSLRVFLCADVMTGRGIDQVLPHPVDPVLYEPYVHDAREYVDLAEKAHGSVERAVSSACIWVYAFEIQFGSARFGKRRVILSIWSMR